MLKKKSAPSGAISGHLILRPSPFDDFDPFHPSKPWPGPPRYGMGPAPQPYAWSAPGAPFHSGIGAEFGGGGPHQAPLGGAEGAAGAGHGAARPGPVAKGGEGSALMASMS